MKRWLILIATCNIICAVSLGWSHPPNDLNEQKIAHAFACGYIFGQNVLMKRAGLEPLSEPCPDLKDLAERHGFIEN